ncbi:MAG: hypothetical protein Q4A97_08020 [Comamonadaceae bacterium]|nr:hypothetical protein [Comamonadaceae bacterium]
MMNLSPSPAAGIEMPLELIQAIEMQMAGYLDSAFEILASPQHEYRFAGLDKAQLGSIAATLAAGMAHLHAAHVLAQAHAAPAQARQVAASAQQDQE